MKEAPDHLAKYDRYRRLVRRLLLFTGLWPSRNPGILYRTVIFGHLIGAIITSSVLLNFCRHHADSLNLFLKGLGVALSFLTITQKVNTQRPRATDPIIARQMICLIFYRKRLVELHATLAATFRQDLDDVELRPILLSPLLSFYRPSFVLSMSTYSLNAIYWIAPVISIVVQLSRGVPVIKYATPLPTKYPWHVEGAAAWPYPLLYAFEIYAGLCLGSFTSIVDSLFGYYIFQITGQLRTLSYRMRSFGSRDNYRKVLSECVVRHQILTRCQSHLEQIYGPIVLWMLVTSAMVMCALIYQASHMSASKAAFVPLYIIMKSVQTLLYGWFGTFLTNENEMFREAIYASDWPGSGEKCLMTDVLVMMTYKPFVLTACTLSTISVDMFVAVSNTALSYFFMLRTLEQGHADN